MFKEEIECTDQPGGSILDPQDVKVIFGGIPSIYDIHIKIRDELGDIVSHWSDDAAVGAVFMKHVRTAATIRLFLWCFRIINLMSSSMTIVHILS